MRRCQVRLRRMSSGWRKNFSKGRCLLKARRNKIKQASMITSSDHQIKPALFTKKREELALSSQDLEKLMRGVFDKGSSFRFKGKGYSMSPFIKDGDVLTIAPLQGSSPRFGDVMVFTHPTTGKLVIHRLIG